MTLCRAGDGRRVAILARNWTFESISLQRRVRELSVPERQPGQNGLPRTRLSGPYYPDPDEDALVSA